MVIFFHRFVTGYEERKLRRRFAYAGYVRKAPRWIPRPPRRG
jgi:protein-S-isoprenylcysteine O-methyltransferase Ste14